MHAMLLLDTKFHIPLLRQPVISRQRLTIKLDQIPQCKLSLIVAPAGFGKTTLICEWMAQGHLPVAWLSLDEHDNHPARFFAYLIQAFHRLAPDVGAQSLKLLESAHSPQLSTVLTHLTNDLAAIADDRILVLDDYHIIDDPVIHEGLDFLIAHTPPSIHIVITSRHRPMLNLSRLRGQRQLLELTSADLRLTAVEVEYFLHDVMQIDLPSADRIALEMRTEGWIAGVQLAGLSLQTQADPSAFIASFAGTDRHIADYLFDEVLRHQSNEVRQFLMVTSVVDSICSDLCDALLGTTGTQSMLERLDAHQLFIVPLDNQRQWYRYHHLFTDLLRQSLAHTAPAQIPLLHRSASFWYESQDRLEDAIRHGLLAEDFERTADLIETAFEERDWVHHDMHRLLDWFDALPKKVSRSRPRLIIAYLWLLLEIYSDRWAYIEEQLRQVEHLLNKPASGATYPENERNKMRATVDLLRANHARYTGDSQRVIDHCQRALAILPQDENYIRSGTLAHLASAYEGLGNLEEASSLYIESIRLCQRADNTDGLLFAAARFIELCLITGQLQQAVRVFAEIRDHANQRTGPDIGAVSIAIGEVYRQQNQLETAKDYLTRGIDLCRPFEAWHGAALSGVVRYTYTRLAEGLTENEAFLAWLDIGGQISYAAPLESAHLESVQARLYLSLAQFENARQCGESINVSTTTEVDYAHEYDHLTLIRLLMAQATLETQGVRTLTMTENPLAEAETLLHRLYNSAKSGGRLGRVIEICILRAIVLSLRQQHPTALDNLHEALTLAEPEGYTQMFIDEGAPLYQLLAHYLTQPLAPAPAEYAQSLLALFPQAARGSAQAAPLTGDRLTESELQTLRLLATERSTGEIADELSIAISTVRTYAKRIYSKLNVHSRAEAVYRARELNLL